jgi:tight adherence protein C
VQLILGVGAIGLAIVLIVLMIALPRASSAKGEVATGLPGGVAFDTPVPVPQRPNGDEELPPLYQRLRGLAARLSPADYGPRLQRRLDLAGNPRGWKADRILAFKGLGLVSGILLGLLAGLNNGIWIVIAPALIGVAGLFVPDILVRNMGEKRQIELQKGLPDALDMMTVCVEAGLGFDAALMRVALNLEGPIAAEWARVLQEMQFGMSRTEALRALVNRTDVPELRTFVSSLIQSAELGISVGVVLREQAKEMRIRRRQRAEEKAQKLPVKILMPLITCMLPAMFIVVLGPAIINIAHTFGRLHG